MRYEEIEHTADVGIRAYGSSLPELFENAAAGMFSLIADPSNIRAVGEVDMRVKGRDLPQLMVNWLQELLFLHETQRVLFCEFEVSVDGLSLAGKARGEEIDKKRHELKLAIKAVTYHGMIVDPAKGVAQIIFDI